MMVNGQTYQVYPLGDRALVIDFGKQVSEAVNETVLSLFDKAKQNPLPFLIEAVPAYTTLTLFFDTEKMVTTEGPGNTYPYMLYVAEKLVSDFQPVNYKGREVRIPVCYDASLAPDLLPVARAKNLSVEELIQIHTAIKYRVYMLGFLPGFPYLGITDPRIHIPRKPVPVQVTAGSVALAGNQTGIYPFQSPGGWQVIGRTPVAMFRPSELSVTFLQPGDTVRFYSIHINEYYDHQGGAA